MKREGTDTVSAGLDPGEERLGVAVHGIRGGFAVESSAPGWRQLAKRLAEAGGGRIGIEATGGYERGVARHLRQAGFTVVVPRPLQVRAVARPRLRRAKNDRIDAALIAACTHLLSARGKLRRIRASRRCPITRPFSSRSRTTSAASRRASSTSMIRGFGVSRTPTSTRKLLIHANAVVARGTPWQDPPAES